MRTGGSSAPYRKCTKTFTHSSSTLREKSAADQPAHTGSCGSGAQRAIMWSEVLEREFFFFFFMFSGASSEEGC